MKKRIFSRLMAMIMALSLLSTTGFAASFSALQDAIDGKEGTEFEHTAEDGTTSTRYGYGEKNQDTGKWGVEAWNDGDTRNVKLNEDVEFDKERDTIQTERAPGTGDASLGGAQAGILISGRTNGKDKEISIDLNGNTIDLNPGAALNAEENKFYKVGEDGKPTDTVVADGDLNHGAVIEIVDGANVTINDSSTKTVTDEDGNIHYVAGSGTGTITGGNRDYVNWRSQGGGLSVSNADLTMNGGNVTGNRNNREHGGGIYIGGNENATDKVKLNGVSVQGNRAAGWAGGIYDVYKTTVTIKDSIISNNKSADSAGVVCVTGAGSGYTSINNAICNNSTHGDLQRGQEVVEGYPGKTHHNNVHVWGDVIVDTPATCHSTGIGHRLCKSYCPPEEGEVDNSPCRENITIPVDPTNHDGETEIRGAVPAAPGVPGYTGDTYCLGCGALIQRGEVIPALPMPVDFGDGLGGGEAGTTIDDEATPLAGLFTRADAIGYLWEQSGSPEAELSTFADVPEDHYWAVAIGWAEDNGIALPDEEGNFRPDDLVLRTSDEPEGELQEFLNRYAVFAGVELEPDELFFVLDGAADDIIMGEDAQVIFDAFFAKLEKTLAEQEKAA